MTDLSEIGHQHAISHEIRADYDYVMRNVKELGPHFVLLLPLDTFMHTIKEQRYMNYIIELLHGLLVYGLCNVTILIVILI